MKWDVKVDCQLQTKDCYIQKNWGGVELRWGWDEVERDVKVPLGNQVGDWVGDVVDLFMSSPCFLSIFTCTLRLR